MFEVLRGGYPEIIGSGGRMTLTGHAGHDIPRHPLLNHPITHVRQFHSKMVKVHDDADRMYADDDRWTGADGATRQFAFNILTKIAGETYPVTETVTENGLSFYTLAIYPTVTALDVLGRPIRVNRTFIVADYCIPVSPHPCPEAA